MIVGPFGEVYTYDVLWWLTSFVSRVFRACRRKRRGRKLLFAAATVMIYATVGVFTDYLVSHNIRMSQCHNRYCTPAQLAANQQFLDGFGWSVFYTMACFTTALVCILALVLKLHEDLAWNIPTRKLMMQVAPDHPLDKLESQIKRFLYVSMWVLLALGAVFILVLYGYARSTA